MPRREDKPTLTLIEPGSAGGGGGPHRKLGKAGTALWGRVQSEYRIEDAGGSELLLQACSALDRAEALAERIAVDGETFRTRLGVPKSHPAIKDELAARAFVVRTLERLGITSENVKPVGRPGAVTSWSG
jgi:hypothetical protein